MYRYDEFDAAFVGQRVDQFRDQVARRVAGELTEEQFRPHRLMNGLYLQLHAYMLRIAIPLALAELGWMSMGVVDTIMVGRLPDSAVSIGAASVGNALFYSFAIFGIGLMSGLDTLVSQAFGANDRLRARRALASGLGLALCAAPVLSACILGAAPLLLALALVARKLGD